MARSDSAGAVGAVTETGLRVTLPGLDYYRENIACQAACPAGTDARGLVTAIARGEYAAAWDIARQANPFAAVCGSACSAPCEASCRRGAIDSPIAIAALQRFAAGAAAAARPADLASPARAPENSRTAGSIFALSQYRRRLADQRKEGARVAVIGSGPAGLTAAHDLSLLGHAVDIFEASDRPGGMMLRGIPEYVLPRSEVAAEIAAVLEMPGLRIEYGRELGAGLDLDELCRSYDLVILAIGDPDQWRTGNGSNLLSVPELVDGFRPGSAVELVGQMVVVAGGCDRSIAAARTAARIQRNAGQPAMVTMVAERVFGSSAAASEAAREGVRIETGFLPEPIVERGDGFLVPLGLGRESILADVVVLPMGSPQLSARPSIDLLSLPANVFIAASPSADEGIVYAVKAGHDAALAAESHIQGAMVAMRRSGNMHSLAASDFQVPGYLQLPPQESVQRPPARRGPFEQPDLGFSEAEARAEAQRCLKCNVNTVFESPRCITCGDCVDVCPHQCLDLVAPAAVSGHGLDAVLAGEFGAGLDFLRRADGASDAVLIVKDESTCTNCGLCVEVCPTDVIGFEWFGFSEELELLPGPVA